VKSYVLQCEIDSPLGYSQTWFKTRTAHLVEVRTDEGLVGWGEIFGPGKFAVANKAIVENVLKPIVLGLDPFDVELIWHRMYNGTRDYGQKGMTIQCMSGIDIALWDIMGKATGRPLYRLLGGKFRDRIMVYGYGMLFRDVPDLAKDFAEEAASLAEQGYRALKMKIGKSPKEDVDLAAAVRFAVGNDVMLMADANHAYTAQVAIPLGRKLENLEFYWFEEPVAPEDYGGYVEVKNALDIAIAGGEAEYTRWGFRELIRRRCVDILQPEVCGMGGITEYRKVLAMASAEGIPVIPHIWGSEIAVAVNIHLIASLPDMPGSLTPVQPMLEYDTTPNIFRTELATEPLDIAGQVRENSGYISIPEKAGIGVEPDDEVIHKYRIA